MPAGAARSTAGFTGRTATLAIDLTVEVVVAAGLARGTAALTRQAAAPGTTELLVIRVVEGYSGINTAGPCRVSVAVR